MPQLPAKIPGERLDRLFQESLASIEVTDAYILPSPGSLSTAAKSPSLCLDNNDGLVVDSMEQAA